MKMLRFALAPALALMLSAPAFAQAIPLSEISRYLNSIGTAEAPFTQVNADGSTSTGTVYIKRPGRARFEYNGDKTLVLASGGQVAIFDPKSNQPATQYPLSRTPLNLILGENIDLGRAKMVVGQKTEGKTTTVIAQDPEHPDYGTISLVFSANPTQLRQWIITDEAGKKTVVVLGQMRLGADPGNRAFSIDAETRARRN